MESKTKQLIEKAAAAVGRKPSDPPRRAPDSESAVKSTAEVKVIVSRR